MLKWFKKSKPHTEMDDTPLAPGRVVYAIGDVHGRADLLRKLLAQINDDIAAHPVEKPLIVFLGDYIDRGDDSAEVLLLVERLWSSRTSREYVFLMGNHEAAMLDFLDEPEARGEWLRFGGLQTLHSFGLRELSEHSDGMARLNAARVLREKLASQEVFLRTGLRHSIQVGNIFLCHAGIDPDLSLEDQPEETLLWGDSRFLKVGGPEGVWIVHGHTITSDPDIGNNRIGIDTGAYYSSKLTAARIAAGSLRFITT